MPDPLQINRIAVTGAAAGIGRALCVALVGRGAAVATIDRDPAIREIVWPAGAGVAAIQADLSTAAGTERAMAEAWAALGGLDALVNVAGIYPVTPALELDEAEWDRVLATNLKAPFFCSRALARRLIEAGRGGRIVNVSSTASTLARPSIAHYGASKAGLNQLTRVLALEWAPHGILVNAVLPGVIETERVLAHARSAEGEAETAAKMARIPLRRFGTPAEVVELCLFLLTGADYCTGALFTVDGGYGLGIPRYGD
jgi:NAD(P)-dependent dehydrogenase (short-subunit alcohol dehydrogenase family)